ncbi:MAG: hypothetical protein WC457_04340 [Patescibacteria group bacterium]
MRKKLLVAILIIALLVLVGLITWQFYGRSWWEIKKEKISIGLSEPNFPWRDRTQDELNTLYPQIKNADVATRTTPEQTYAKFREGLKNNDLPTVLDQLFKDSSRYESNVAAISKAYNENKFTSIYEKYPEVITSTLQGDSLAQYVFIYNNGASSHHVDFNKNSSGDWKITQY